MRDRERGVRAVLLHLCGGAAACLAGGLISLVNYRISAGFLRRGTQSYLAGTVLRQLCSVGLLVACFFLGENTDLPTVALLVGAVLGLTVPSFFLTGRLLKLDRRAEEEQGRQEEEEKHG